MAEKISINTILKSKDSQNQTIMYSTNVKYLLEMLRNNYGDDIFEDDRYFVKFDLFQAEKILINKFGKNFVANSYSVSELEQKWFSQIYNEDPALAEKLLSYNKSYIIVALILLNDNFIDVKKLKNLCDTDTLKQGLENELISIINKNEINKANDTSLDVVSYFSNVLLRAIESSVNENTVQVFTDATISDHKDGNTELKYNKVIINNIYKEKFGTYNGFKGKVIELADEKKYNPYAGLHDNSTLTDIKESFKYNEGSKNIGTSQIYFYDNWYSNSSLFLTTDYVISSTKGTKVKSYNGRDCYGLKFKKEISDTADRSNYTVGDIILKEETADIEIAKEYDGTASNGKEVATQKKEIKIYKWYEWTGESLQEVHSIDTTGNLKSIYFLADTCEFNADNELSKIFFENYAIKTDNSDEKEYCFLWATNNSYNDSENIVIKNLIRDIQDVILNPYLKCCESYVDDVLIGGDYSLFKEDIEFNKANKKDNSSYFKLYCKNYFDDISKMNQTLHSKDIFDSIRLEYTKRSEEDKTKVNQYKNVLDDDFRDSVFSIRELNALTYINNVKKSAFENRFTEERKAWESSGSDNFNFAIYPRNDNVMATQIGKFTPSSLSNLKYFKAIFLNKEISKIIMNPVKTQGENSENESFSSVVEGIINELLNEEGSIGDLSALNDMEDKSDIIANVEEFDKFINGDFPSEEDPEKPTQDPVLNKIIIDSKVKIYRAKIESALKGNVEKVFEVINDEEFYKDVVKYLFLSYLLLLCNTKKETLDETLSPYLEEETSDANNNFYQIMRKFFIEFTILNQRDYISSINDIFSGESFVNSFDKSPDNTFAFYFLSLYKNYNDGYFFKCFSSSEEGRKSALNYSRITYSNYKDYIKNFDNQKPAGFVNKARYREFTLESILKDVLMGMAVVVNPIAFITVKATELLINLVNSNVSSSNGGFKVSSKTDLKKDGINSLTIKFGSKIAILYNYKLDSEGIAKVAAMVAEMMKEKILENFASMKEKFNECVSWCKDAGVKVGNWASDLYHNSVNQITEDLNKTKDIIVDAYNTVAGGVKNTINSVKNWFKKF